jgi:hypothetical protein
MAGPVDLALDTSRSGLPSPLQSDHGWGGGSDIWSIVDGLQSYDSWANGLAFTGGSAGWGGEPGGTRQATIDFGASTTFNDVVLWWHGVSDTPSDVSLSYWDDLISKWVAISFARNYGAIYEPGQNSGYSNSDEYLFGNVTGSKVRMSFNDLAPAIDGSQMVHGWLYEFEVFNNANSVPEPATLTLVLLGFGPILLLRKRRTVNAVRQ